MDQIVIGSFLRELRKDKNMTQEQLAEQFGVTGRSVSRWENGSNLPDIALMMELAEFYGVGISELLNGHREETAEGTTESGTLETVIEYADTERNRMRKQMLRSNVISAVLIGACVLLYLIVGYENIAQSAVLRYLLAFTLGFTVVIQIRNIMIYAGDGRCLRNAEKSPK